MGNSTSTVSPESGAAAWFPSQPTTLVQAGEWRLDVVTLLAVIGEASMAEHSQTITASTFCLLPRILPAPQALLKPSRPPRLPETPAKMAGVRSGVVLDTVGFFAEIIIGPLGELSPYAFKAIEITHRDQDEIADIVAPRNPKPVRGIAGWFRRMGKMSGGKGRIPLAPTGDAKGPETNKGILVGDRAAVSTGNNKAVAFDIDTEHGGVPPQPGIQRRLTAKEKMTDFVSNPTLANRAQRPVVPVKLLSPMHFLSVFSFILTVSMIVAAVKWDDAPAILAVGLVSLASSVVGYASWWQPLLMNLSHTNKVPPGDVVLRTREGAFVYIKCQEAVARELFYATEECQYRVGDQLYRLLMGLGTMLLMVSVVLLGNCSWNMQLFIGVSYIVLNGLYWALGMLPRRYFWDLSRYRWKDITPKDALGAEGDTSEDPREGSRSFTRTLWYTIRETEGRTGWVERSGAAPGTKQWKAWLREAKKAARKGDREWPAVKRKNDIMKTALNGDEDSASEEAMQHAPLSEVQGRRPSVASHGAL